jgi:Xaa-Pro aminopeptidase
MPKEWGEEDKRVFNRLINEEIPAELRPPKVQAFSTEEYAARLTKLRGMMANKGIDVVLLSSPESQCWLHGLQSRWYRTGSSTKWPPTNFTVVHRTYKAETDEFFVFDTSDHERMIKFTSVAKDLRLQDGDPNLETAHSFLWEKIEELIALKKINAEWLAPWGGATKRKWGIEKWSPRQNAATTEKLVEQLNTKYPNAIEIEDVSVMMRELQLIKSDAEIALMRKAAGILEVAYKNLADFLTPDKTEIEVWAQMELEMAKQGGETSGLHNTVSLTRSYCHDLSSTRRIGPGQLLLDPCAVLHRYHVNAARQFWLTDKSSHVESEQLKQASTIAAGAVNKLLEVAHDGVKIKDVSKTLHDYYVEEGLWDIRDWIGGYQLGIAFTPDWVGEFTWSVEENSSDEREFKAGMVTNFESFVGGAGFIDTILIKKDSAELLTNFQREVKLISS